MVFCLFDFEFQILYQVLEIKVCKRYSKCRIIRFCIDSKKGGMKGLC